VKFSPESGAAIYSLSISVEIPPNVSLQTVEEKLNQIQDQLNVNITME
jgi:glycine cleavage system regulatory protein